MLSINDLTNSVVSKIHRVTDPSETIDSSSQIKIRKVPVKTLAEFDGYTLVGCRWTVCN